MNYQSENTAEILDRFITGFRQYIFGAIVYPTVISSNFCEMTGYTKAELESTSEDRCAGLVVVADRAVYDDLFRRAAESHDASAEYRLQKKDGSVIFVRDTVTVKKTEDGVLVGYSVLTDITDMKAENENLRFLNDTVPCGMLKYTCEKNPRITFINRQMLEILRFPEGKAGEADPFELCRENIFMMIPMDGRRKFSHFLNQVSTSGRPISGEMSVLRCDGSKARLLGWVTKVTDADGNEEFQSVCMDVTEQYHTKKAGETERYLKALSDVYENLFEYDFTSGTVRFIYGGSDTFRHLRNVPMHMEQATDQWIEQNVYAEDRFEMHRFFANAFSGTADAASLPPQVWYRIKKGEELVSYSGIFLKIDSGVFLFCCRKQPSETETHALRCENHFLKSRNENMQEMIMRYTDGIAAFEVTDETVTPLYASDNVCEFFGFTKEEWLPLMKQSTSIKAFVAKSAVDYEKFTDLLATGEAEFTYYDIESDTERKIKAICSQKKADASSPRYIMLYNLPDAQQEPTAEEKQRVFIRTFGYFDVFINEKPIAFRNRKAKELLALLVDRRGGFVTSEQAIACLWENESANPVTMSRYRKEALRLKNTLEEYGIGYIMESVDGNRRIIPDRITCDLYDHLSGKGAHALLFKGSYLNDYAWGEVTLGELTGRQEN